ncbi:hypothetical protein KI688_008365 [Linnemannia hyalina]|uniref:Arrestin C-terminal-like domain-containing protein n=1 Tax=Linnemannia hyalina TaxID=64524 RepID=A0A9P8BVT4_9FUNG|nr:hypothetical protein KI688_008365 [Linnemannia hyalina]
MAVSPSPPPPVPSTTPSSSTRSSTLTVVFAQGGSGSTCLLRPNAVVRGHVELKLIKPCHASGVRLSLKAEESAIVLGQESNGDSMRQKFQQTVITLFDTEVMVSGSNQGDNELANWQEIAPGSYTFPFALKVPNVNFPPCIPGLDGFSIRYVWKAHVESPFEPSLSSEEVLCQFMPNVLAPKPQEWTYREVVGAVMSKSTTQVNKPPTGIDVSIKMHQQVYVPGDPLSMAMTLVNNGQGKVAAIDMVLRRTIKGTVSTSYANLSNQSQTHIMTKTVECKVRSGETGQVDILTTIPPLGKYYSIPTFESNFLKVYYELLCIVKVKRSVFSGGDTTYQCAFPIPIATHNVDNPIITGRTPRWTKSRLQPYFFESAWADPVGDLPGPLVNTNCNNINTSTDTLQAVSPVIATGESIIGMSSLASASAASLLSNPGSSNAMQEFLTGGSVELHRERTLKKSLTRSKSMKDLQTPRLNGSTWRAEREQLLNQTRDLPSNNANVTQLDRSITDGASSSSNGVGKRSPPLGATTKSSTTKFSTTKSSTTNDDWQQQGQNAPGDADVVDSNGNVGYTPPPPTARPPKSAHRELTPEQQAELARKASRRILPNQGMYNNDGILPPEIESRYQPQSPTINPATNPAAAAVSQSSSTTNNNASLSKPLPRRNASLSQKSHYPQHGGASSNYIPDQDTIDTPTPTTRGNYTGVYEPTRSNTGNSFSNSGGGNDQGYSSSSRHQQDGGYPAIPERMPYQHSLPAHQQPPGVIIPVGLVSPPLLASTSPSSSSKSTRLERSPSRRDVPTTNNGLSNLSANAGDFMPPPPFNRSMPTSTITETNNGNSSYHQRQGSAGSNHVVIGNNSANNNATNNVNNNNSINSCIGNYDLARIPPWERVERVHHQNWFRPGPHQTGALQAFDAAGLTMSNLQSVPILKKTLQHPVDTAVVHSIEVEEHLR